MKEDIQIHIAAGLADADAPENISGDRARSFVESAIRNGGGKTSRMNHRPAGQLLVWGTAAVALAAAVVLMLLIPAHQTSMDGGLPASFMEMESSHASMEVADSSQVASRDTTAGREIEISDEP